METTIALPEVYTQKSMPVDIDSIPRTEELSKWPYLRGSDFETEC